MKTSRNRAERQVETDTVRTYLLEMGRIPLLTHEQEIQYARQVQQLIVLEEVPPDDRESWAVASGIKPGDLERITHLGQRAKKKMIESNLRLVVSIAKKYQHRGLELLDLIQEGSLGLNRAVELFDPERGFKFSTYATWWIRQSMTRAIADKSRVVRIPNYLRERMAKIRKASSLLSQELGRVPTSEEISVAVGITPTTFKQLLSYFIPPISLNQPIGKDETTCLGDLLPAEGDPLSYVEQEQSRAIASELLEGLSDRQQQVILERFGLIDGVSKTLDYLGKELNLTRERVRQIEKRSLDQLKARAESIKSSG
ncbi:MAG: sigma-70 family RNA polymerase sigma factor, partial [Thermosynechococcaceae cyanobacterium]